MHMWSDWKINELNIVRYIHCNSTLFLMWSSATADFSLWENMPPDKPARFSTDHQARNLCEEDLCIWRMQFIMGSMGGGGEGDLLLQTAMRWPLHLSSSGLQLGWTFSLIPKIQLRAYLSLFRNLRGNGRRSVDKTQARKWELVFKSGICGFPTEPGKKKPTNKQTHKTDSLLWGFFFSLENKG